jgi:hypothetical protein
MFLLVLVFAESGIAQLQKFRAANGVFGGEKQRG